MRTHLTLLAGMLFMLMNPALALAGEPMPTEKEALAIISTHERLKSNLYKIVRLTRGKFVEKDGFIHEEVIRVTAFSPMSGGNPKRELRHFLMKYHYEYGWFLEKIREDARGTYLEISSQKKGRVFVR